MDTQDIVDYVLANSSSSEDTDDSSSDESEWETDNETDDEDVDTNSDSGSDAPNRPQDKHRYLCLKDVTTEQCQVIEGLFTHNNWDYNDCTAEVLGLAAAGESSLDVRENPPLYDRVKDGSTECQYCFCGPCITAEDNRQMWWADRFAAPRRVNRRFRKEAYRKFWTMLLHKGVWGLPQYKAKKQAALEAAGKRYVYHRRDILPKCVVSLVRKWYPNPPGIDYLGHRWE